MENVNNNANQSAEPMQITQPAQTAEPMQTTQPAQTAEPNAEPAQANPYESIIEQQQQQIDALLKQTETLNAQITRMVENGAQFNSQPAQTAEPTQPGQAFNPKSLAEHDAFLSMEDLAKEIGKH